VFATIHSGSCIEAVTRIVSAFPSEIQSSVAAQLADCLEAVVCQRLRFHKDPGIRIPECEILRSTPGVKSEIRRAAFTQITSALETGADNGMWTFDRYGAWVAAQSDWYVPSRGPKG
jgi:twitching motility protein PilT